MFEKMDNEGMNIFRTFTQRRQSDSYESPYTARMTYALGDKQYVVMASGGALISFAKFE